ncbi:origin recognition complex subunit 2 [Scheffersomyces xylosifermentans]|uniref:origin recognition complex subunit 2 n=1 Tax=Scheffersomyces xylosifermentans TaxID=1304137 RepID=UPI00315D664B
MESPFKSPFKSPTKRGPIRLEFSNKVLFSPTKTPNGRAGLRSPRKRPLDDLDKSARKRAVNNTLYSRLMEDPEADDSEETILDRQDAAIAEMIIKESRKGKLVDEDDEESDSRAYGSDVELEEDLTVLRKRRATRPSPAKAKGITKKSKIKGDSNERLTDKESTRKRTRGKRIVISEGEEEDDDEDEEEEKEEEENDDDDDVSSTDNEVDPDAEVDDSSTDVSLDDSDVSDFEEDTQYATRSSRKSRNIGLNLSEIQESPTKKRATKQKRDKKEKSEPLEKKKVGRPSKSDEVVGKVKSIFQQDDEFLFSDSTTNTPRRNLKKSINTSSDSNSIASTILNNTTELTSIPIISGVKEDETLKDSFEKVEFKLLPLPDVDSEGNIDKRYMETYLSGSRIEEILKGRLLDEKAFFLEGSEGYFEQHNGRGRASNSVSMAPLLDYSEFIPLVRICERICISEKENLSNLHKFLYHQWCFELSQGYNLNFYGIGSKLALLKDFVHNYFVNWFENAFPEAELPTIMVVNGFHPTLKFKKVLHDIVSTFIPSETRKQNNIKFPKHVSETIPFLINYAESRRKRGEAPTPKLVLMINNIDGECFRNEKIQNWLSQLASLPEIWLISSVDNINAPLLWDSFKLKNFNFIWHDLSTYSSYSSELSFRDVLSLGMSKKFVGQSGANHILSALTGKHKEIYKVLLLKQVSNMKNDLVTKESLRSLKGTLKYGVELKILYQSCMDAFLTSDEMNFRMQLREYVEHKMCKLMKDDAGVEIVFIPFNFGEMEKILTKEFNVNVDEVK